MGRPVGRDRELLFDRLCVWIEENVDHEITTLTEVHSKMEELDPTDDKKLTYTRKYLKEKLQDAYADTFYFTSQDNKETIFCLKNTTNAILREYKTGLNDCSEFENDSSLKDLIIRTASTLILHDLDRVHCDNKQYPSICSMASVEEQLNLIPESLKTFLEPIVKSDDKLATWSQNLLKAYKPRSAIMSSQLGLSIQVDHKFGSKWLIYTRNNDYSIIFCSAFRAWGYKCIIVGFFKLLLMLLFLRFSMTFELSSSRQQMPIEPALQSVFTVLCCSSFRLMDSSLRKLNTTTFTNKWKQPADPKKTSLLFSTCFIRPPDI